MYKDCTTKFYCKYCGESDMRPNYTKERGNEFVRGWRCNVCGEVAHPIIEEIKRLRKISTEKCHA